MMNEWEMCGYIGDEIWIVGIAALVAAYLCFLWITLERQKNFINQEDWLCSKIAWDGVLLSCLTLAVISRVISARGTRTVRKRARRLK